MFKKLEYFIIFIFFSLIQPLPVHASLCGDPALDFKCLESIYSHVIRFVIMPGLTIVFFVTLLSGGIKWLTSSGDPKDIENAKGRITFAVFGLILSILAYFILHFISDFTKVPVIEQFKVPS